MTPRQLADIIAAALREQGIEIDNEGDESVVLISIAPTINLVLLAEKILKAMNHGN